MGFSILCLVNLSFQILCDFPNNECLNIPLSCLNCTLNKNCIYGKEYNATCHISNQTTCRKVSDIHRKYVCRYCYQTPPVNHICVKKTKCLQSFSVKSYYLTNCTVNEHILCLGNRVFYKMLPCNWTEGKSWITAFCLSLFFGGFGADRFYLGMWQMGLGKLFTFGGLGVWTFVDWVLIAFGYLKPSDGSVYV